MRSSLPVGSSITSRPILTADGPARPEIRGNIRRGGQVILDRTGHGGGYDAACGATDRLTFEPNRTDAERRRRHSHAERGNELRRIPESRATPRAPERPRRSPRAPLIGPSSLGSFRRNAVRRISARRRPGLGFVSQKRPAPPPGASGAASESHDEVPASPASRRAGRRPRVEAANSEVRGRLQVGLLPSGSVRGWRGSEEIIVSQGAHPLAILGRHLPHVPRIHGVQILRGEMRARDRLGVATIASHDPAPLESVR